jgi:hypothetical protein
MNSEPMQMVRTDMDDLANRIAKVVSGQAIALRVHFNRIDLQIIKRRDGEKGFVVLPL